MERLTKRNEADTAYYYPKCFEKCDGFGASEKCNNCVLVYDVCEKLGDYEDLEEQGLLMRLPCKIGASVYMVAQDCGGDTLDCRRGDCEGCPYLYSFVEENSFDSYMCDDIGKTVFLTKEEAEKKLKESGG